jgi:hypothetical protein
VVDDKKLLERISNRFAAMVEAESEFRKTAEDDLRFVRLGDQWYAADKKARSVPGQERPTLVINRILQFRQQIVNEARQLRPSLNARPVNDGADIETAEIYQGLLRHIQEASDASIAYDTAAESQIDTGKGYFRVNVGYIDNDSFDQEIKIERIHDQFKVYYDEMSTAPDGSDARDCIIMEEWSIDDFREEYPNVKTADGNDELGSWINKDTVRVAEYHYIESADDTLCEMKDGSTHLISELPTEFHPLIKRKRKVEKKFCKWVKRAGNEIIERTEIPCSFLTIIPVYGAETWVDGKRYLHGLTRFAKDAQRLYNYNQSANTEFNALAPKVPFICAEGQLEGHESQWANANRVNFSYLEYKPVTDDAGAMMPPPRREPPPSTNPAYEAAMNRSVDDMKACMGIYDASLGNREGDQSGKAILSQQRQASLGNFHFTDNQARSIKHAGRVIIDLIPKIYDTKRVIRILGEDGTAKQVTIDPNAPKPSQDVQGETIYNLGSGKYDVVINVGPTYETKRQEAADNMINLLQKMPIVAQVAGDLIVQELDFPGGQEIAKRLKTMLPPQIQQEIQSEDEDNVDPQAAQMLHRMADQMQHLSQIIQQLQTEPDRKRLEIEEFKAWTDRMKVEADIAAKQIGQVHDMAVADLQHQIQIAQFEQQQEEGKENGTNQNQEEPQGATSQTIGDSAGQQNPNGQTQESGQQQVPEST